MAPSTGENKGDCLGELAQITQRGLSPAERQIIRHLVEGASLEDLCVVMNKTPDQVSGELARIRWKFRALVKRHGFDKNFDADVQGFIKGIGRALAK